MLFAGLFETWYPKRDQPEVTFTIVTCAANALIGEIHVYIGEVRHRGVRHPGQHQPIVDRELWEKVQRQLHDRAVRRRLRAVKVEPSPLVGKLFDPSGAGLTPSHALQGGRRLPLLYLARLNIGPAHRVRDGWRLPAPELERTLATAAQQLLTDEPAIATTVEEAGVAASQIPSVLETTRAWSRKLQSNSEVAAALATLVQRVELRRDGMRLSLRLPLPTEGSEEAHPGSAATIITRFIPMRVQRRGVELRLVIEVLCTSRKT